MNGHCSFGCILIIDGQDSRDYTHIKIIVAMAVVAVLIGWMNFEVGRL